MAYGTVNADVIGTSVTGSNLGAGNASIMKNRIINGAMVIDQRGGTISVSTGTATYGIDRWSGQGTASAGVYSFRQTANYPAGFNYALYTTIGTADASLAATDLYCLQQRIEGYNVADLGWGTASAKTVTLSFWVRSNLTGTFGGSIANGAFDRSYPFTYTISVADTWEQKTITIAGDTTGTWLTTNGIGMTVRWSLGAGSTYSGTAGAWAGAGYISATGATNVMASTSNNFYITGVQLEVGTSATGFEYRQYGQELALCQRYCPVISSADGTNTPVGSGLMGDSTNALIFYQYPVAVRTPATGITVSAANQFSLTQGTASFTLNACNALTFNASNINTASLRPVAASGAGMAGGFAAMLFANSTSAKIIFTGCEL